MDFSFIKQAHWIYHLNFQGLCGRWEGTSLFLCEAKEPKRKSNFAELNSWLVTLNQFVSLDAIINLGSWSQYSADYITTTVATPVLYTRPYSQKYLRLVL